MFSNCIKQVVPDPDPVTPPPAQFEIIATYLQIKNYGKER